MKKIVKTILSLFMAASLFIGTIPAAVISAGADVELKIKAKTNANGSVEISISPSRDDTFVTYTTNGSVPVSDSLIYTSPFTITGDSLVRAAEFTADGTKIAAKKKSVSVTLKSEEEVPAAAETTDPAKTADPAFSMSCSAGKTTVTITCATKNSVIYYTIDGSAPTEDSPIYAGPVSFKKTTKLCAIARGYGKELSSPVSITADVAVAGAGAVSKTEPPAPEEKENDKDTGSGNDTAKTDTDNKENTESNNNNNEASDEGKKDKKLESDTPEAAKVTDKVRYFLTNMELGGTYVSVNTSKNSYTIYYTTDGSAPTKTNGRKYTSRVKFTDPGYFRAYEYNANGAIVSKLCIQVQPMCAKPTMECIGYTLRSRTIALSTTTKDAEIYYTIDETNPEKSKTAIKYTEPFNIPITEEIRAIAIKDNCKASTALIAYAGEAPYTLKEFDFNDPVFYRLTEAVNRARASNGMMPLVLDEKLTYAAMMRAEELDVYYDHKRPNGLGYMSAISEAGIGTVMIRATESNMITKDVEEAMAKIVERKDSILDKEMNSIGVGYFINGNGNYIWCFLICSIH